MDQHSDQRFEVERADLSYQIRPAFQREARMIRQLIHEVRINPMDLDWRRFKVAVDQAGTLLGCGQVKPHRDGSLELASIAVKPEYQRRGVATEIIRTLLADNPGPLYLTCRASLGSFYERFGFQRVSAEELPLYFRRLQYVIRFARRFRRWEEILVMIRY